MRIPLAIRLGVGCVISGERESHSGRIKLNQTPKSIDAYINLMQSWGLSLGSPETRRMPVKGDGDCWS